MNTLWLWIHTSLITSGVLGLIISFSSAVMYLLQAAQLKSKKFDSVFFKLPSLEALDKIHFRFLSGGVVLFTSGLLTGFFWAKNLNALGGILTDPEIILSFLTCLVYWIVLSFRLGAASRGQKIAIGTVFSFLLLFVTIASILFAPSWYHRRT